ncbi:MAG: cytochrome c3 family protein [Halioglobus sp.]
MAWRPANFSHTGITGNCQSCHNGTTAEGKGNNHIPTTQDCVACHATVGWRPANFSHAGITGNCQSCHNGTTATGKGNGHFLTGLDCSSCHTTAAWSPNTFRHSSPNYPGQHSRNLQCNDCHTSNAQAIPWRFAAYQPACAGCHARDYESGPHTKYNNPTVKYNVSELRDCSGACHTYTDSTLTTISRVRSGEHRVGDRSFD